MQDSLKDQDRDHNLRRIMMHIGGAGETGAYAAWIFFFFFLKKKRLVEGGLCDRLGFRG